MCQGVPLMRHHKHPHKSFYKNQSPLLNLQTLDVKLYKPKCV